VTKAPLELNSYIVPGRVADVRDGLRQAQEAESIGLAGIFVSERWESKEIAATIGALSQVTERVRLVAGLTHFGTRHPLVLAGMGATLQTLSGGRFSIGFGRGVPSQFRRLGIPVLDNAGMADSASLLRRLWSGETVEYRGSAGDYPAMQLAQACSNPPPILLGAVGPKTLRLAGEHFDGVVLHPFLTVDGVARSAQLVRDAALDAGRDPLSIRVYATVVTAPDSLSEAARTDVVDARAVSYFMHREVGLPIISMNGWDAAPVERLAAMDLSRLEYGRGDVAEVRAELARAKAVLPPDWLESGAAVGSTAQCLARLQDYQNAGADEILLHGTIPNQQRELVGLATP
jgi:5,10-methylenetetrahydromethanopterin reductase